mmetsp:Transcript_29647/g.74569  ORF Transcript_29647/g.74569 Transcript_29647/m.74569 type:complete len:380 (-) Transcript_29647:2705-3844(-)
MPQVNLCAGGQLRVGLARPEADVQAAAVRRDVDEVHGGAAAPNLARHAHVALRGPLRALIHAALHAVHHHAARPLDWADPGGHHHVLHMVRREEVRLRGDVLPRLTRHRPHLDVHRGRRGHRGIRVFHALSECGEVGAGPVEHHPLAEVVQRHLRVLHLLVLPHVGRRREGVVERGERLRAGGGAGAEGGQAAQKRPEVQTGGGAGVRCAANSRPHLRVEVGKLRLDEYGGARPCQGQVPHRLIYLGGDDRHTGEVLAGELECLRRRVKPRERRRQLQGARGEARPAVPAARDIQSDTERAAIAADGNDPGTGGVRRQRQVEQRDLPGLRGKADKDAMHSAAVVPSPFLGLAAVKLLVARGAAIRVEQDVHIALHLVHH